MFKVGDHAILPRNGVAVVTKIDERSFGDEKKKFYILEALDNNSTIIVPVDSPNSGIRPLISPQEVDTVYDILKNHTVEVDLSTWNRRYREYTSKIETGSIFEIAVVLRNLWLLRDKKDLSFGERKMMDKAKYLLIKEISLTTKASEQDIEDAIYSNLLM